MVTATISAVMGTYHAVTRELVTKENGGGSGGGNTTSAVTGLSTMLCRHSSSECSADSVRNLLLV